MRCDSEVSVIQLKEKSLTIGPTKGKDFDCGNIMGLCLVTPDDLDVRNLEMTARINGEVWSEGKTADMYWSWPRIIEYISESETLSKPYSLILFFF